MPAEPAKLLIESDRHETRIALLEDGRPVEIYLERPDERGFVGNVYRGRVSRVLPGIQAAFVDIGLERDAFLYVGDVLVDDDEGVVDPDSVETGELAATEVERAVETLSIDELLTTGQELLVQVVKDPLPNKGARITTQITLPGRFLVLMPASPRHGVSRRITDEAERERLLGILEGLGAPGGLIARTAAAGRRVEEFRHDLSRLVGRWHELRETSRRSAIPALVHRDLGLVLRTVRDLVNGSIGEVVVGGAEAHHRVESFLRELEPDLDLPVRLDEAQEGLLARYGVERELEAALEPKVWLRSGGYIVISPTEALVAIDVNTGRFVGHQSLEETVVRTNLEAAQEIVRQIRLRNLGGIIVVDFIDMAEPANRERVLHALERELAKDRARHQVLGMSDFGLVEITRKRTRPNLARSLTRPCPCCAGRGRIRDPAATALALRRELLRRRAADGASATGYRARLHPDTRRALEESQRPLLDDLAATLGSPLALEDDPLLGREAFELARAARPDRA